MSNVAQAIDGAGRAADVVSVDPGGRGDASDLLEPAADAVEVMAVGVCDPVRPDVIDLLRVTGASIIWLTRGLTIEAGDFGRDW